MESRDSMELRALDLFQNCSDFSHSTKQAAHPDVGIALESRRAILHLLKTVFATAIATNTFLRLASESEISWYRKGQLGAAALNLNDILYFLIFNAPSMTAMSP